MMKKILCYLAILPFSISYADDSYHDYYSDSYNADFLNERFPVENKEIKDPFILMNKNYLALYLTVNKCSSSIKDYFIGRNVNNENEVVFLWGAEGCAGTGTGELGISSITIPKGMPPELPINGLVEEDFFGNYDKNHNSKINYGWIESLKQLNENHYEIESADWAENDGKFPSISVTYDLQRKDDEWTITEVKREKRNSEF